MPNQNQTVFSLLIPALIIFLMVLPATGCTSSENDPGSEDLPEFIADADPVFTHQLPDQPESLSIRPDLVYNEDNDVLIGDRRGPAAVDGSGRLLISDNQQKTVHVFEPDGSYSGSLGRDGSGPGEFSLIADIAVSGDTVHILDAAASRISLYSTKTMEYLRDRSIALTESETEPRWMIHKQREGLNYRPTHFFVKDDGNYLIASSDGGVGMQDNLEHRTYEFSLFDTDREQYAEHDLLSFRWTGRALVHWEPNGAIVLFDVPFNRTTAFAFDGERLIAGWTEDAALNVYDSSGAPQHALNYPLQNTTLRWNDAESFFREVLAQRNTGERIYRELLADTPETWPAFHSLILDDEGQAWISLIGEDREIYDWRIIDIETGDVQGGVSLKRYREIIAVQDGFVYIKEQEDEEDLPRYLRYLTD